MSNRRHKSNRDHVRAAFVNLADGGYRRSTRLLMGGLIGVAILVGLATLYCYLLPSRADRASHLRLTLSKQVAASDYDGAMESLLELQQISPDSQQLVFQQAALERARGNNDLANALINDLIERQYPEAAWWHIERCIDQRDRQWTEEQQDRFAALVAIASKSKDSAIRVRVKQRWAANRLQVGALEEALVTLEELSQSDSASSLHAASIAKQLGMTERARGLALTARRYFAERLKEQPTDDQCRLSLARTQLLLDQEAEAVQLLSEGFVLTQQPKFQQAAGEAMICWANRLHVTDSAASILARVRLVHRATQCAPSDQAVLSALIKLMRELSQRPEYYQTQLRHYITQGHDPESGHFMLGLLALAANDLVGCKLHLDLAEKAGSHVATVLNNLALAALEDRQLTTEQALLLADEAIRRIPSEPRFRETRSRFLMREQRYEAAIVDLIAAAEVDELKPLVHKNIVLAYQALGDDESAKKYQVAPPAAGR